MSSNNYCLRMMMMVIVAHAVIWLRQECDEGSRTMFLDNNLK